MTNPVACRKFVEQTALMARQELEVITVLEHEPMSLSELEQRTTWGERRIRQILAGLKEADVVLKVPGTELNAIT